MFVRLIQHHSNLILVFLISSVMISCSNESDYPLIFTGEVTDIDSNGATFHGSIADLSNGNITGYGFVWSENAKPTIEDSEKSVMRDSPEEGIFSAHISTTLKAGFTYYVRAFIKNEAFLTYGKEVSFISLGSKSPEITDFTPKAGNIGDTVIITGNGFSYIKEQNTVKFGEFKAQTIRSVQDTLIVLVPDNLNAETSTVSVSISGNKTIAESSFKLVSPDVTGFFPGTAPFGSTITISGNNFQSSIKSLKVYFGNLPASVKEINGTGLMAVVPDNLDRKTCFIKVVMNNLSDSITDQFSLELPVITDINPGTSTFGSEVVMTGSLFDSNPERIKVFVDRFRAVITDLTSTQISFIVPDSLDIRTATVSVDINGLTSAADKKLIMADLVLNDFFPKQLLTGGTFTVTGENFSPVASNNSVMIGNVEGTVISSSTNTLTVRVPLQDKVIYNDRELTLSVDVLAEKDRLADSLILNDNWFRLSDFPGTFTSYPVSFVEDGRAYIGLNNTNELWCFNPVDKSWKRLADFPGEKRGGAAGFSLNGKLYYGTGGNNVTLNMKDIWEYNISTDKWTKKNDFPGFARCSATGFNVNNTGYITSGRETSWVIYNHPVGDCWEYDELTDSWSEVNNYDDLEWGGVDGLANGAVAVCNGIAYYGLGWCFTQGDYEQRIFSFEPSSGNVWKRMANFPVTEEYNSPSVAFSLGNCPYFKTLHSSFYKYNPDTESWTIVETKTITGSATAVAFSVDNTGYVGFGSSPAFWEYDPSR